MQSCFEVFQKQYEVIAYVVICSNGGLCLVVIGGNMEEIYGSNTKVIRSNIQCSNI